MIQTIEVKMIIKEGAKVPNMVMSSLLCRFTYKFDTRL